MKAKEFVSTINETKWAPKNRVMRVFQDINLGNGHKGLREIARKDKFDFETLNPGDYAIFINRRQTALKMVTAYGTTQAYLKMPGDARLNLHTVQHLPRFFSGGSIQYISALKTVLGEKKK